MGKLVRRVLLFCLLSVVLLGVALLFLVGSALEPAALVVEAEALDPDYAQRARQFARQNLGALRDEQQPVTLTATEKELSGLLALASRASPNVTGRVNLSELGMLWAVTLRLPANPLGRYLNIVVQVEPSSTGLYVDSVRVGGVRLPRVVIDQAPPLMLDLILGDDQGTQLLHAIQSVSTTEGRLAVVMNLPPDLDQRVASAQAHLGEVRDAAKVFGDPVHVRSYYQTLMDTAASDTVARDASLVEFLGPLFRQASDNSAGRPPETENEAAVLALVIYLGSARFESLVGTVRSQAMKSHVEPADVVLAGRQDLRLHFLISAGLKLVSMRGASMAIGEFKELLDSGAGGSGFSFADLAADRAGVRFASVATDGYGGAARLQATLSQAMSEASFFPDITGLPEGLSEAEFQRQYGGLDDPRYAAMLEEIDARIDRLPAYGTGGLAKP